MKLFRVKRKAETEEEEKELVLDTDAGAKTDALEGPPDAPAEPAPDTVAGPADPPTAETKPAPEAEAAEAAVEPPAEAPASEGDLLSKLSAEADTELAAEEAAVEGSSSSEDDPLDPELLDIFRDARNEVQESTLASELEHISIDELLRDAVAVSQRLMVFRQSPAGEPAGHADELSHDDADLAEPDDDHEP